MAFVWLFCFAPRRSRLWATGPARSQSFRWLRPVRWAPFFLIPSLLGGFPFKRFFGIFRNVRGGSIWWVAARLSYPLSLFHWADAALISFEAALMRVAACPQAFPRFACVELRLSAFRINASNFLCNQVLRFVSIDRNHEVVNVSVVPDFVLRRWGVRSIVNLIIR